MDSAGANDGENVDTNDSEAEACSTEFSDKHYVKPRKERDADHKDASSDRAVSSLSSSSSSSNGVVNSSLHAPPPDGGWGWVIVFACFMINLITDGVSFSFGILFVDFSEVFGESKAKTSWVGSVFLSMPLLAGPIASYLTDRYGCRKVCIAGALLSSVAFLVSIFANSLEILFFTFTVAGLGLALCYVASIVAIAYYFEKKRSLATGLATCGTGVGTFILPPLTIYLVEEYGWQGTLLILSGFFLKMVVFGALMRDFNASSAANGKSSTSDESWPENLTLEESERLCNSLVQLPTYFSDNLPFEVITEISNKEGGHLSSLLHQHPYLLSSIDIDSKKNQRLHDLSSDVKFPTCTKRKPRSKQEAPSSKYDRHAHCYKDASATDSGYLRNMRFHRGSLTYRGAMLNIRRYRLRASSCPDIYRNSMVTIGADKTCSCVTDLKDLLLDMFDISIFKNVQYTVFCISNFLLYACVDVPYVYIPDLAHNLNYDMESASYLISVLGVLNTLGVVIVGYVGDKTWIDSSLLYSVFITTGGLLLGIVPWIDDYYGLASICGAYGFTISANYTLVPIIIVNLISLDNFTGAYGMLLLAQGIATLVGPPFAGFMFDVTGNYDITFFATGLVIVLSGIMSFPFSKVLHCKRKGTPLTCDDGSEKQGSPISKVRFKDLCEIKNNATKNDVKTEAYFQDSNSNRALNLPAESAVEFQNPVLGVWSFENK